MENMYLLCFLMHFHGTMASSNNESSCASWRTADSQTQTETFNHKYDDRTLLQYNQLGQDNTIPLEQALGQQDFTSGSDDGKLLHLFSRMVGAKTSSKDKPDNKLFPSSHADLLVQFKSSFIGMTIREVGPENYALLNQLLQEMLELTNECQHLVRVGKNNDGGYMVCEDSLRHSVPAQGCLLFSYGIADDDSFDRQMHQNYNCEVHQFDPTVHGSEGSKIFPDQIHFHKEGLSGHGPRHVQGLGRMDTLANHFAFYNPESHMLVLKVDIEEAEWMSFHTVADSFWDNVEQLILEFHSANATKPGDVAAVQGVATQLPMRLQVLTTLKKHFYLVHVHMNNFAGTTDLPGHGAIPNGVEATFMKKTLMVPGTPPYDNHLELDQPCSAGAEDIDVSKYRPI